MVLSLVVILFTFWSYTNCLLFGYVQLCGDLQSFKRRCTVNATYESISLKYATTTTLNKKKRSHQKLCNNNTENTS